MPSPSSLWQRAVQLYTRDIWRNEYLDGRSPRARLYAFLRVVSITLTGINETKTPSRAASLSFSTLLGLGPLMAIAVLVAGFVLDRQDPDLAVNTLNKLIKFVAPQVTQYEQLEAKKNGAPSAATPTPATRSDVVAAASLNIPPGAAATSAANSSRSPAPPPRSPRPARMRPLPTPPPRPRRIPNWSSSSTASSTAPATAPPASSA